VCTFVPYPNLQSAGISDLTELEFASALAHWVRMKELNEAQASLVENAFIDDKRSKMMNASPLLAKIARALRTARLEVVMVGNAAAALHGAPVTTLDIDFMFRKTPTNMRKLKVFAKELEAQVLKPYYPVSSLYRVVNDDTGMQIDFMSILHGIKSFESLRSDAVDVDFEGSAIKVASLEKIIRSKKTLGRPRDLAVIEILEKTLDEKKKRQQ
jgi:predicted nucleotidyltransferase